MISGIIKVKVLSAKPITLTETSIIEEITKTGSNDCFIIYCFKENNDKHTIARNLN